MSDEQKQKGSEDAHSQLSPHLRAQLSALLASLADCRPAAQDDLPLFFHSCVDSLTQHAHSFAAFSPQLKEQTASCCSLIRLLASLSSSAGPSPHLSSLLSPLPSSLSSPLISCLTSRHSALLSLCLQSTAALTPSPTSALTDFDYSVRLITASSSIAQLRQPSLLLTLHTAIRPEGVHVELSTQQLDAVLEGMEEANRLLLLAV